MSSVIILERDPMQNVTATHNQGLGYLELHANADNRGSPHDLQQNGGSC